MVPPGDVGALSLHDALEVAGLITLALREQSREGQRVGDAPAWVDAPAVDRRALVWQAMGFLNAGLGVGSEDALALLRGHAYAEGSDLDDLARRVLDRELPLEELTLERDVQG